MNHLGSKKGQSLIHYVSFNFSDPPFSLELRPGSGHTGLVKFIYLPLLVAVLGGCSADPALTMPDQEALRASFASARGYSSEPGFESIGTWVTRPHETRLEIGRWLPRSEPTLLVTLDLLDVSHAEGMLHHLVAVVDPVTHERLTPVFHYVAHHARRTIMNSGDRQRLLYVGRAEGQSGYRRDTSFIIAFSHERVDVDRLVGDLDPENHAVMDIGRGRLRVCRSDQGMMVTLKELTWEPDQGRFVDHTQPDGS